MVMSYAKNTELYKWRIDRAEIGKYLDNYNPAEGKYIVLFRIPMHAT